MAKNHKWCHRQCVKNPDVPISPSFDCYGCTSEFDCHGECGDFDTTNSGNECKWNIIDKDTGEILPVPLRGIFDWIESDDTLVEMKTSGRIFDTDSSDSRLQLTAYDYAYRELFDRRPKIKILNLVKTKEPKLVEKEIILDKQDTRNLIGTAKLFLAGVQNKLFYPNKSFMCKNCEYGDICGIPIE